MRRERNGFKLRKPKLGIFFASIYFLSALGLAVYLFMPKSVDASSRERLLIPSIGLIASVENIERHGTELTAPEYNAGAYYAADNKVVLIGHSTTVFKNLSELVPGESFTFDKAKYRVEKVVILEKSAVDMKQIVAPATEKTVVLMTCYGDQIGPYDYTHRFIVTAKVV